MKIVPRPDQITRPYWEGARDGRLLAQKCRACGHLWHPPQPSCPACVSFDMDWVPLSGRGEVYSFTVVHHPAHVAVADKAPYLVALVELEEGPRIVSNILNCPAEDVRVGLPVRVVFDEIADGVTLPQFEPAGG